MDTYTTDSSAILVRAAFYNNDGIQMMNKGNYRDAIAAFTLGLEILRGNNGTSASAVAATGRNPYYFGDCCPSEQQAIDEISQPYYSCNDATTSADTRDGTRYSRDNISSSCHGSLRTTSSSFQQQQYHPFILQQSLTANTSNTSDDDHTNFIFRDAIEIPIQSMIRSRLNDKMVMKLSIVVLYNLGLSFHLSAMETNSLDKVLRAKMLYEMAFEMHMEEGCDVTLLYTLALMNNLGLIYHVLGECQRSQHCFQSMLSTMMFLLEADDARKIKQWDGLLSNVLSYVYHDSKVAAPAA